jgi:YHS domain-containing protein
MDHLRKYFLILGLVLALCLLILPGVSLAKEQTKCPVMGGLVNKNLYVDHQGSRVYFCCPPCLNTFRKNPDFYVKQMKDQGITLAKSPDAGS